MGDYGAPSQRETRPNNKGLENPPFLEATGATDADEGKDLSYEE